MPVTVYYSGESSVKTKKLAGKKGDNKVEKAVIEGYGPLDLIDRVRNAAWTTCIPSGRNFEGIVLGDCVLTDAPDEYCSIKFRVTLETLPSGDNFTIEGYNSWLFLDSIHKGSGPTTFAGCWLTNAPNDKAKPYRVTVEAV